MAPRARDRYVAKWRQRGVRRCVLPLATLALVSALGTVTIACGRSGRDEVGRAMTTSIVIAVDAGGGAAAMPTTTDAEDDAALARDLRSALEADDTLSARARRIDIDVVDGHVTLRGRVANPREHDDVLGKARRLGAASIVDEIEVTGTRKRASPAAPGR